MSVHKIKIKGGTSARLPTAGKYCDRDIIIEAEGGGIIEVDKLPTENIDPNALYLCNGDYYKYKGSNEWYFNETIELPSENFEVAFTSNGEEYLAMEVSDCLYYSIEVGDETQPAYWVDEERWEFAEYRTITLLEEPTNPALIEWINANATKKNSWQKYVDEPVVYSLESVDELPSDAINGSVAIVKCRYTRYTLQRILTMPDEEIYCKCLLESQQTVFVEMLCAPNGLFYGGVCVYTPDNGWVYGFDTLYLYEGTASAELEAWLNDNYGYPPEFEEVDYRIAVYVRENGEWVVRFGYSPY